MVVNKPIKRNIFGYFVLFGLLSLAGTLQAATPAQLSDATPVSYDYTLQNHADQISPIEEEAYLDIEEMSQELAKILNAITQTQVCLPQLLAVVTYDLSTQHYVKYLFASNDLLPGSEAQQKAHNLNYHLVKAPEGPVIWQVLSFLGLQPNLEVKECILPKDTQLCLPCGQMAMHLFDKKLPMGKAGCQEQPFPTTTAPASAVACFYSDLFTNQQRRLVICKIGAHAFPNPKKLITPSPAHQPTFQPIQPATPQTQLHVAVQLQFPIDVIKVLLTSSQIGINTLDSSGKTPLDYATQGSNLYHLLVRHHAKTSLSLLGTIQAGKPTYRRKIMSEIRPRYEQSDEDKPPLSVWQVQKPIVLKSVAFGALGTAVGYSLWALSVYRRYIANPMNKTPGKQPVPFDFSDLIPKSMQLAGQVGGALFSTLFFAGYAWGNRDHF